MKKNKILVIGLVVTMMFSLVAMLSLTTFTAFAAESDEKDYCLYEDETGGESPVFIDGNRIYANGTSLIVNKNQVYVDLEPYGELGEEDRPITIDAYTVQLNGNLSEMYLETGSGEETKNNDCYITIEESIVRGVYVNYIRNATVSIKSSDVLRHYIENATGDVNYTIDSNTGDVNGIGIFDTEDNSEENGGLIEGDLNLTLNNVKNESIICDILASGTVLGDTKVCINNSSVFSVSPAHNTGSASQDGNVCIEVNNSQIEMGLQGICGGSAKIQGNIEIYVKDSEIGAGISGFGNHTRKANSGETYEYTLTGNSKVYVEASTVEGVQCGGDNCDIAENTEVTVVNSTVGEIVADVVSLQGNVVGWVESNTLNVQDGTCLTGNISVQKQMSGKFTWQPDCSSYIGSATIGKEGTIASGTAVKIVPVKKTDEGYIAYEKTEKLPREVTIEFFDRLDAANYLNYFACDYNDMQVYKMRGNNGSFYTSTFIEVLNYCEEHDWSEAAGSGIVDKIEYAEAHDKEANCAETGIKSYYCTKCDRYELRTIAVTDQHDYQVLQIIEPTEEQEGYTIYKCSKCGKTENRDHKAALPKEVNLANLQFTVCKSVAYTGKKQTPNIVVKDKDATLIKGQDYRVSYKNNKNIGTATAIVEGCGKYYGTKTLTFQIVPKKNKVTSAKSQAPKTISLKWKRDKDASGYVVQYSTDKNFKKAVKKITIKKNKTTTTKIKKLKSKKTYYIRVASYKKVKGKTYTGIFSPAKKVKVK